MISVAVLRKFDGHESLKETTTMKKMMGFILLGMLIILFAACGGNGSNDNGNSSTTTTTATVSSTSTSSSSSSSSSTSTSGTTTTTLSGNAEATGVNVSLAANTPAPHVGVFCTTMRSITATMDVSDADGDTLVEWKWYDRSDTGVYLNPIASGSATVAEANGTVTASLTQKFGYHHHIKFEAIADGVVTDTKEAFIL
jgi:hypothetical protein